MIKEWILIGLGFIIAAILIYCGWWFLGFTLCGKILAFILGFVVFAICGFILSYPLGKMKESSLKGFLSIVAAIACIYAGYKFYDSTRLLHYREVWDKEFVKYDKLTFPESKSQFVTKWGKHYHFSSDCPAIKGKRITMVKQSFANDTRKPCSHCYPEKYFEEVYVTPNGQRYHSKNNCRWINGHFVKKIDFDELDYDERYEWLTPCNTCIKGEE